MIKGYKGFNNDLKCSPNGIAFQYKVGETYENDAPIQVCRNGFHFCELPHQVFSFYSPGTSEFATVTGDGTFDKSEGDKVASSKITIEATVSVFYMVKVSVKCFFEKFKFKEKIEIADTENAGDRGAANAGDRGAANAGDCGAANAGNCGAANAGDFGAANAGDRGAAIVRHEGSASVQEKGIAVAFGQASRAKGGLGSVLVLTEWDESYENIICVKALIVNGKTVKADTYYTLKDGKRVIAK